MNIIICMLLIVMLLLSTDAKKTTKVGKLVNERYEIIEKLGSGSFGKVYSAIDNQTKKKVAIKLEKILTTDNGKSVVKKDVSLKVEYDVYQFLDGIGKLV